MAPKLNLLFISILLLSLLFTSIKARPMREFSGKSPKESDQVQMNGFSETDRFVVDENSNSDSNKCSNGDREEEEDEECLMRRTLAAHVDYIYTQKDKKP